MDKNMGEECKINVKSIMRKRKKRIQSERET